MEEKENNDPRIIFSKLDKLNKNQMMSLTKTLGIIAEDQREEILDLTASRDAYKEGYDERGIVIQKLNEEFGPGEFDEETKNIIENALNRDKHDEKMAKKQEELKRKYKEIMKKGSVIENIMERYI